MKRMTGMLVALLALLAGSGIGIRAAASPTNAVSQAPPPSAPAKKSAAELEKLAMPIALHPDPLISIILPAAVYPVELVLAARFVKDTNNISKVDSQPWDENVKAVAKFPALIAKMNDDLEWTIDLGQAFLEQRKELMDTIQSLRAKAQRAGTLKTTEQQTVTVTNSIVERVVEQQTVIVTNTIVQIEPSNPEVIYVPSYPPTVYYPPPAYSYGYAYYGYGYYPYAPLMTFGVGMMWGAAISHWNHCNWHGGDVDVDINRNTNINRDRNTNVGDRSGRTGDRAANRGAAGDRAANRGAGGSQRSWQPDQGRLQKSGVPSAKTREARGWGSSSASVRQGLADSRRSSFSGGAQSAQRSFGGAQQSPARSQAQPARAQSPNVQRRTTTTQRPASASTYNRSAGSQRSSAFSGVNSGGGSTRNYSNRGSYSRGGGGFSGGGGARGGGGRGGGGRR